MRQRLVVLGLVLVGFMLVSPGRAMAHGFGLQYDLPVPYWLFLYGAAAAVVLTFVLLANLRLTPHRYPRFDLLRVRWFRATLASRAFLFGLRLLSVALFSLVVLSGLLGNQSPTDNLTPTFVWVIWWVGLAFLTALIGNLWELVNPWKITFEWANALAQRIGAEKGLGLRLPYPAGWGVWPALALYFGFAWVELVFLGSAKPSNIAVLALLYSAITWGGMFVFGKDAWLRGGEAFSVFFGILARFAPTEARVTDAKICEECGASCRAVDGECVNCYECFEQAASADRQLNLRPWAVGLSPVGLSRPETVSADRSAFVIFMLASVTYDGLIATPLWVQVRMFAGSIVATLGVGGVGGLYLIQTLGLYVVPLLFLAAYLGFVKLSQFFGGGHVPRELLATAYVFTLVPIALAYQAAHYYTYLLIQGQAIIGLISDPFGWGWNLLGTADYKMNVGVVSANFVWYSQVAFIVVGHMIAVYLAHGVALWLLRDHRRAVRSQYPMLALMVLYTVFSLWILHQPAVEGSKMAAMPTGNERSDLARLYKETAPYTALSRTGSWPYEVVSPSSA